MQAIAGFKNAFQVKGIREKIFFTLAMLVFYRLGGHITTPGINTARLSEYFAQNTNNIFGLYNAFTGGAFQKATVFALGIMPYITASIIIQMMGSVIPTIQQWQREGSEGRAKITQWTRYFTVLICLVQSWSAAVWLSSVRINTTYGQGLSVLLDNFATGYGNFGFKVLTTITLTTGTVFIMWLGEQITARGIGNGISLIIFIGIISTLPSAVFNEYQQFIAGNNSLLGEIIIIALVVSIIAFIVFVELGTRRIPLQSPRRVVGRKVMGGQSSYIPFKVNTAGVIPVIFASTIMFFPAMIASLFPNYTFMQDFAGAFLPGRIVFCCICILNHLFCLFLYCYTI